MAVALLALTSQALAGQDPAPVSAAMRWTRTFERPIAAAWPVPNNVRRPARWVVALLDGRVQILNGEQGEPLGREIRALPGVALLPGSSDGVIVLHDALSLIALRIESGVLAWRTDLHPPGTRDIDPEWRQRYLSVVAAGSRVLTLDSDGRIEARDRASGASIAMANATRPAAREARLIAASPAPASACASPIVWHLSRRAAQLEAAPVSLDGTSDPRGALLLAEWPLGVALDSTGQLICLSHDRIATFHPVQAARDRAAGLESQISRNARVAPPVIVGDALWFLAVEDDQQLRAYAVRDGDAACQWSVPVAGGDSLRLEAGFASDVILVDEARFERVSLRGDVLESGPATALAARRDEFRGYRVAGETLYVLR